MTDPRRYAAEAHQGQTYGSEPYTVHLEAVVAIVREVDPSPLAEAVAWLHDVLEDCAPSDADLVRHFGREVAVAVACVTDPEGPNRRVRKARLHAQLGELDPERGEPYRVALLVKAADRLANVRASAESHPGKLSMYRREHAAFRAAAHRPGLCDEVWAEIDRLLGE